MKELSLPEVFAEILSGVGVLVVISAILMFTGAITPDGIFKPLASQAVFAYLTVMVLISYFLGVVMGIVGFAIGESFLDERVPAPRPTPEERERFWANVPEHVLKYRESQWSYYVVCRNLLITPGPGNGGMGRGCNSAPGHRCSNRYTSRRVPSSDHLLAHNDRCVAHLLSTFEA
jgi:hypothetical protein